MSNRDRAIAIRCLFLLLVFTVANADELHAQDGNPTADEVAAALTNDDEPSTTAPEVAKEVQVEPVNSDEKISNRLTEILLATGWFIEPKVRVDRGVVFLSGKVDSAKHQQWAEATAINTSDVVAVVNRIEIAEKPIWNFAPAIESLKQLGREFSGLLPLLLIALVITVIAYFLAIGAAHITHWIVADRVNSKLLRQVVGNVAGVLVFVIGIYIALRVSGLTRLAVTLLGGTSLVGLALGFAFRDIAENYLASILISLNHPFRVGDLIEVAGTQGFVRKVTTRGTILNTLEGNQVQLPNNTVYKSMITNYTATPLRRLDFSVGIGFEDSASEAQAILMGVLREHEAVAEDPAPVVIVESLGSATVNLRVLYWFDQTKHSPLKVGSSVIRQAKQQLTSAEITMPDEARELVFPQGVPVQLLEGRQDLTKQASDFTIVRDDDQTAAPESDVAAGEGDLRSEQAEVMRATNGDQVIDEEVNLIE